MNFSGMKTREPSNPVEGQIYFDAINRKKYIFLNGKWEPYNTEAGREV